MNRIIQKTKLINQGGRISIYDETQLSIEQYRKIPFFKPIVNFITDKGLQENKLWIISSKSKMSKVEAAVAIHNINKESKGEMEQENEKAYNPFDENEKKNSGPLMQLIDVKYKAVEEKDRNIDPVEESLNRLNLSVSNNGKAMIFSLPRELQVNDCFWEGYLKEFCLSHPHSEIYIFVDELINAQFENSLRFEGGFNSISVKEPSILYLTNILDSCIEESGYSLASEYSSKNLMQSLLNARKEKFQIMDIQKYTSHIVKIADRLEKECLDEECITDLFKVEKKSDKSMFQSIMEDTTFVGLQKQKELIQSIAILDFFERERGAVSFCKSKNMVFAGAPGTGKTEFALWCSCVFEEYQVSNGKFSKVSAADIKGKYVGHTEHMVRKLFEQTKGGIIFLDELSCLLQEDSFTQSAITEFVRYMEIYPETTVIFAGYPEQLDELLKKDSGLSSRIREQIVFEDYSYEELYQILCCMVQKEGFELEECYGIVSEFLKKEKEQKGKKFGNAREVRNLWAKAKTILAMDAHQSETDPNEITIVPYNCILKAIEKEQDSNASKSKVTFGFQS